MGPTNRPKSPATILEARGSIGMQRYILCRLQRLKATLPNTECLIVTERVTLNMFNITCYVTIRTGMRSIPVTECLRPNPLQPQARAIECPTRPFGAPRSACDRDEWGTRSHPAERTAGGTNGRLHASTASATNLLFRRAAGAPKSFAGVECPVGGTGTRSV